MGVRLAAVFFKIERDIAEIRVAFLRRQGCDKQQDKTKRASRAGDADVNSRHLESD